MEQQCGVNDMEQPADVETLRGLHFFPVPDLPLAVFRDDYGEHARHAHDFVEIVLVIAGSGTHLHYRPRDDRPLRATLVENDLFVVPLGWSHAYIQPAGLRFYNLLFNRDLLAAELAQEADVGGLFQLCLGGQPASTTRFVHKVHLRLADRTQIEHGLRLIARELMTRRSGFRLAAKARLVETLVQIGRAGADTVEQIPAQAQPADSAQAVLAAVTFMEEHLAAPIRLADIARAAHLSPAYFCDLFRATTGLPPGKYLTRLRLEHAKYLLLTTSLPVTEVAQRSGFTDSSYFARVFRTVVGVTPRRFQHTQKCSASSESLL